VFANGAAANDLGSRWARMWEYEEYSLTNTTWSGNPFDLVATATFTHAKETRTTEMFYVGSDTWKFRFTGTRIGVWTFSTSSSDAELDGHTGSVIVRPRTNSDMKGFLTHVGNKYAIMVEDVDHLEGYVYQVFMNQQDYEQQHEHSSRILGHPSRSDLIADYWNNTRENGFDIYFFAVFYSWFRMGALSINDFSGSADPNLDNPIQPCLTPLNSPSSTHTNEAGAATSGPGETTIGDRRPITSATDSGVRDISGSSVTLQLDWDHCLDGL